jgi:hypothetical protein
MKIHIMTLFNIPEIPLMSGWNRAHAGITHQGYWSCTFLKGDHRRQTGEFSDDSVIEARINGISRHSLPLEINMGLNDGAT